MQNLFGENIGVADHLDNRPMTLLSPEQQVAVYEQIDNTEESEALFLAIRDSVRRDDHRQARFLAMYLQMWAEDDQFQTPWPQWRQKMLTEVAELAPPKK